MLIMTGGQPVAVMLAPGVEVEVTTFKNLGLDLAPSSRIFADAGHLDEAEQAPLAEGEAWARSTSVGATAGAAAAAGALPLQT